jgi:superfamily I DNA/RNA helicase
MERLKVNGPPGTGKTRFLLDICEREIERGRLPHEIIFCSFTRAAAAEARDRAMARFGGSSADYPWFATEHSICFRLLGLSRNLVFTKRHLRDFGKRYRYDFTGDEDEKDNLDRRYHEGMLKSVADHYEFFVGYMRNRMLPFSTAYREFLRSVGYETPDSFTRSGLEIYIERREQYKQEHKLWSFDDMISEALNQRLCPPEARVLILDESQDCSPLLWELIKVWASQVESYYIAGDPLQTLYFWAGSSPELFYNFPGEEQLLSHSYRLTPQVKDFAQKIIERTTLPFPEYSPSDRHGEIARQPFMGVDWENVGECFVLARTRWLISQLTGHFLAKGIPFTSERGKHSPLGTTKGRAFYTLVKLAEGERVSELELANLVKHTGPPFLKRGAKTKVRNLVEGRYGMRDLADMGFTPVFTKAMSNGFESVLRKDIEDFERAYLLKVLSRGGRQAFEQESKIVVTTIHGSKGREKPVVYLCPDLTRKVWDGYARYKIPESLVYYVGATRSIDKLVVLVPQQKYVFPLPR